MAEKGKKHVPENTCQVKGKMKASSADDDVQEILNEQEKKLETLMESEKTIFQEFEKHESVYENDMRKMQEDIQKYSQNEEKLRSLVLAVSKTLRPDERILKLAMEQQALGKRINARKQLIGTLEIEKMRGAIKFYKRITSDDDVEGMKKVDEMMKELKEMEADLEGWKL